MHDSYKKCYTNTFQTVKTICRIQNPSAKKGDWAILMFVQSETHLKIYLLPLSYSPIFKKSRGHHTKVRSKKLRALN